MLKGRQRKSLSTRCRPRSGSDLSVALSGRILDVMVQGLKPLAESFHPFGISVPKAGLASDGRSTNHQSPFTNHLSPITFHQSPFTNHLSPITFHLSAFTSHQSPLTSHPQRLTTPAAYLLLICPREALIHPHGRAPDISGSVGTSGALRL
jgi:hypothetical protein